MNNIRYPIPELIREDNPDYYKIIDLHNTIMDEWNRLNDDFHKWKHLKIFLFYEKEKIRSYYKSFDDIQEEYLKWNKLATNFLNDPNLNFKKGNNRDTVFIHYTNRLADIKNHLSNNMVLLINNFKVIQERYKSKVNFNIAIFSATISTIGLWIALCTIFK